MLVPDIEAALLAAFAFLHIGRPDHLLGLGVDLEIGEVLETVVGAHVDELAHRGGQQAVADAHLYSNKYISDYQYFMKIV